MVWLFIALIACFALLRAGIRFPSRQSRQGAFSLLPANKTEAARQKALQFNLLRVAIARHAREKPDPDGSKATFLLEHDSLPLELMLHEHHTKPTLSFEGTLPPDALLSPCTISDGYHIRRVFELEEVSRELLHASGLEQRLFERCDAYKSIGCHLSSRHFMWRIEILEHGQLERTLRDVSQLQELLSMSECQWTNTLHGWCISLKREEDARRAALYLMRHDPILARRLIEAHDTLNLWARVTVFEEMLRRGQALDPRIIESLVETVIAPHATSSIRLRLLTANLVIESNHARLIPSPHLQTLLATALDELPANDETMLSLLGLLPEAIEREALTRMAAPWLDRLLLLPLEQIERAVTSALSGKPRSPRATSHSAREVAHTVSDILRELLIDGLYQTPFHDLANKTERLFSPTQNFQLPHYAIWTSLMQARAHHVRGELEALRHIAHVVGNQRTYHTRAAPLLFEHLLIDSPHAAKIMEEFLTRYPPDTRQRWKQHITPLLEHGYLSQESFVPLLEGILAHSPDREAASDVLRRIDADAPALRLFFLHWVHTSNVRRNEILHELLDEQDTPLPKQEEHALLTLLATPGHIHSAYKLTMALLARRASAQSFVALRELRGEKHLQALTDEHEAMLQAITARLGRQPGQLTLAEEDTERGALTLSHDSPHEP